MSERNEDIKLRALCDDWRLALRCCGGPIECNLSVQFERLVVYARDRGMSLEQVMGHITLSDLPEFCTKH
jgi:hypothetical protein